ncbi:MAG TPA: hypothetical protein VK168_11575 [Saprospiraceae bacterium]|nr:hypothetical protein [Saprospiraceae bacterium]
MAKKSLFLAILIAFSLFGNLSFAEAKFQRALNQAESCDAPAPDSFRITTVGGSFISLKWKPVAGVNAYFLLVSLQDSAGGWIPNQVFPNITDTLITVDGLEGGKKYQFKISSKCPNGDVSGLTSIVDGIALIVDLTINGRTPVNPQPISGSGIPYQSLHWLGFRVSGEGASGLFEVQINDTTDQPLGWVRRVNLTDKIVAVNYIGEFPNQFFPVIENVLIPFAIWNTLITPPLVGGINIIKDTEDNPPTVDILIDDDSNPDWKSQYTLTVLRANSTIYIPPGGGGTGQGLTKNNGNTFISAASPFTDHLELKINAPEFLTNNVSYFIFDGIGQLVSTGTLKASDANHKIETNTWPNGAYYLICNNGLERTVLKVIKAGF